MIERGLPIAARQVESRCVGRDALRDLGSALESAVEHLGGNPPHHARLGMISEKVGDHASGTGHGQAGENDPIGSRDLAAVQANIATPRLAPSWKRELVHVRPKIPDSVEARSRGMRDDRVVWVVEASPGGPLGSELKPGGPKPEMVGLPGAANAVNAMRNPFQPPVLRQARQRRVADACFLCLAPGDQPPLTLRNLEQPLYRP
jgi:hypothetical protein